MVNSGTMIAQTSPSAREKSQPAEGASRLSFRLSTPDARFLISPLLSELGVCHGFTTRIGGVSDGKYATLNLGEKWGDAKERTATNLRLVAADAGFAPERLCQVTQVHSADIVELSDVDQGRLSADGMATASPLPLVLGVYSADCVSLLFADGAGRVAAVHAGWRGTVAGIAANAVKTLCRLGAQPQRLRVAMGPSIGPCCFEVKDDVAARFRQVAPDAVYARQDGRLFVDLRRANRQFLLAAGVLPTHIADDPPCTHCDSERFFSYRRDGAGIGQHLAFIVGGGS